jgi:glyoxylase I family protein
MKQPTNPSPPYAILGLDHVVLRVSDISRAKNFYCRVLGCVLERSLENLGLMQLRAGRTLIDLVDVNAPLGEKGGRPPGKDGFNMDHFCIQIEPFDADAIKAHLHAHEVIIGEVGIRYGADGYGPSLYISDPDGNTVELKGPPSDPKT